MEKEGQLFGFRGLVLPMASVLYLRSGGSAVVPSNNVYGLPPNAKAFSKKVG